MQRSRTYPDGESLIKLFTALACPCLEYANVVWCLVYKKDSTLLVNTQRRAFKLVSALHKEFYENRLQQLKLLVCCTGEYVEI